MSTHKSFVLRIARDEWLKKVFEVKRYYPGVARRWESEGLIFLAKRVDKGDSIVGYGVIKEFLARSSLPENERRECEEMGWRGAIVFSDLYRFDPPLPIKKTILGGLKAKGRFLHGYPLTEEQVKSVLEAARGLCLIQAV
ncbi:MAG: hypothetical protein QXL67_01120 [Candidatus Bathyarchaeia archaeon]